MVVIPVVLIAVVPVADVTDTLVSGVVPPTIPLNVTVPVPLPTLSVFPPSTVELNSTAPLPLLVRIVAPPRVTAFVHVCVALVASVPDTVTPPPPFFVKFATPVMLPSVSVIAAELVSVRSNPPPVTVPPKLTVVSVSTVLAPSVTAPE